MKKVILGISLVVFVLFAINVNAGIIKQDKQKATTTVEKKADAKCCAGDKKAGAKCCAGDKKADAKCDHSKSDCSKTCADKKKTDASCDKSKSADCSKSCADKKKAAPKH